MTGDDRDAELAELLGELAPEQDDGISRELPPEGRVVVQANLPYLRNFAREPHPALSYSCDFPVALGDTVLVPPTPLDVRWTEGKIVRLGPSDYRGPVKAVRPKEEP